MLLTWRLLCCMLWKAFQFVHWTYQFCLLASQQQETHNLRIRIV